MTSNELYKILYYILNDDICNFYLIYKFINLLISHIENNTYNLEINSDDLFFYKCKQYLIDTFFCEYVYFNKITYFMKKNYKVFSFDNSLNKFNLFWNLKNPDYQIINIPYENIFENNNFKLMIDLLTNKHHVLLIDHICSDKSIYTIILAVNSINPSLLETLEILYIVNSDFDKDLHFNHYFDSLYNKNINYIKINRNHMFPFIYADLEEIYKMPYYSIIPNYNYFNHNLHNTLFLLINLCFYNFFYNTNTDDINYEILYNNIIKFVNYEKNKSNILSDINL